MSIETVYRERDQLVSALSKVWPSYLLIDSDSDEGWQHIVMVQSPEGQLSWHVSDEEADLFFSHLSVGGPPWDGHTTEDKYRRLAAVKRQDDPQPTVDTNDEE